MTPSPTPVIATRFARSLVVGLLLGTCVAAPSADKATPPNPTTLHSPNPAVGAPTAESILTRTLAGLAREPENDARFLAEYAFRRTKVLEVRDGDGDLKRREQKQLDNDPRQGVQALDAEDLTPEEPDERRKQAYRRQDFTVDASLLKRFEFTLLGTENVAGRLCWVIDFAPAKGPLPSRSLKDRFINRSAGRVWIDCAEDVPTRFQLRLTEPVQVVGGLVGSVRCCEVRVEKRRTDEGVWYVQSLAWHLEGRRLLARRTMDYREDCTDVRHVGSPHTEPDATKLGG